ncbi:hypothetical protein HF876_18190 [Psychrobacillus sp. BL-248-WT-3]|nr:hypothetical protein [Psychrobacillus sp. BL-248-WT-3]
MTDGDSSGMSETDKTSQPRAIAMGDGLSLTPLVRKSILLYGLKISLLYKSTLPFNIANKKAYLEDPRVDEELVRRSIKIRAIFFSIAFILITLVTFVS